MWFMGQQHLVNSGAFTPYTMCIGCIGISHHIQCIGISDHNNYWQCIGILVFVLHLVGLLVTGDG